MPSEVPKSSAVPTPQRSVGIYLYASSPDFFKRDIVDRKYQNLIELSVRSSLNIHSHGESIKLNVLTMSGARFTTAIEGWNLSLSARRECNAIVSRGKIQCYFNIKTATRCKEERTSCSYLGGALLSLNCTKAAFAYHFWGINNE